MWMRAWKTWPILPALTRSSACVTEGFHAIGQLIMMRVRWRFDAASMRRAPSAVAAIGFSTKAWRPRAAAASTIGTPPAFESQTRTASASTALKRSAGFSNRAPTPNSLRIFSRRGLFGSAAPTIFTPGTCRNCGSIFHAWSWMRPATTSRKSFMADTINPAGYLCEISSVREPGDPLFSPEMRSNDSEAFVRLMTEHQGRLFGYIFSLLGDPDAANDVLQEANVILWRDSREFRPGSNFKAWAFRVAHFQVMAFRQRQIRDRLVFEDDMIEVLASAAR